MCVCVCPLHPPTAPRNHLCPISVYAPTYLCVTRVCACACACPCVTRVCAAPEVGARDGAPSPTLDPFNVHDSSTPSSPAAGGGWRAGGGGPLAVPGLEVVTTTMPTSVQRAPSTLPLLSPSRPGAGHGYFGAGTSYPDPVVINPTTVPFKKPSTPGSPAATTGLLFSPVKSMRSPAGATAGSALSRPGSGKLGADPSRPVVWKGTSAGSIRVPEGADVVTGDVRFLNGVHIR